MTVIAYDGISLAADKRAVENGHPFTVKKINRVPGGFLATVGAASHAAELLNWFLLCRPTGQFPKREESSNETAEAVFINARGMVFVYLCTSEWPIEIEDTLYAHGSGRDYALAAMHLGHDARKAVEVASALDVSCGNGVDVLRVVE